MSDINDTSQLQDFVDNNMLLKKYINPDYKPSFAGERRNTIQSIGRGLRKSHDKDFVNIFDICTTNKYSAKHLTERKKYYKAAGYKFTIKKLDQKFEYGRFKYCPTVKYPAPHNTITIIKTTKNFKIQCDLVFVWGKLSWANWG